MAHDRLGWDITNALDNTMNTFVSETCESARATPLPAVRRSGMRARLSLFVWRSMFMGHYKESRARTLIAGMCGGASRTRTGYRRRAGDCSLSLRDIRGKCCLSDNRGRAVREKTLAGLHDFEGVITDALGRTIYMLRVMNARGSEGRRARRRCARAVCVRGCFCEFGGSFSKTFVRPRRTHPACIDLLSRYAVAHGMPATCRDCAGDRSNGESC